MSAMLKISQVKRAESLNEALQLLQEGTYKVVAGGTDVIPQMRNQIMDPVSLLDLRLLREELGKIEIKDEFLCIGALCTHFQIHTDPLVQEWCPVLADACARIGSAQIRKRGTIGGNIINASPAADSVPTLVATGAQAVITSAEVQRVVPMENVAQQPGRTCMVPGELLTQIRIPLKGKPWSGTYLKVGPRNALLISVADAAVVMHPEFGIRIACGSVSPTIQRAGHTEKLFTQAGKTQADFEAALGKDISPISDVRASAQYRRDVLVNLIYQLYQQKGGL